MPEHSSMQTAVKATRPAAASARLRRALTATVALVMLVGAVALGAVGWHYSDEILRPEPGEIGEVAPAAAALVRSVGVEGELGDYPAWYAPARKRLWVLFVHGRGGDRSDTTDLVATVHDLGLPALSISYRNDPEAPPSPDRAYGLGWTEWRDVQAGVDFAQRHGARGVVLVGYSMGGAVVSTFLHQSADADLVRGLILDAPVLDWGPPLRLAARQRDVPVWLTSIAQVVATVRTGIRWDRLDQIERAEDFDVPILLFHGTADTTVPVSTSDAFAAARPDLVTYVRVPGAEHVGALDARPRHYRREVRRFLRPLATQARSAPA